jgi:hypothetical protein
VDDSTLADQSAAPPDSPSAAPAPAPPTAESSAVAVPAARTSPPSPKAATIEVPIAVRRAPIGRMPVMFAVISLVIALLAGGAYLIRQLNAPAALTPTQTIDQFLSAVFLANDPTRVAPLVCSSWTAEDAVDRTTKQVDTTSHVSWDQIRIVTSSDQEVSATARIGLRRDGDNRPSSFKQWRFELKNERGWRVCDASPFDA